MLVSSFDVYVCVVYACGNVCSNSVLLWHCARVRLLTRFTQHLSPSDLGSICIASRYTFFARRGARREVFLSCTPSARLQDTGAVLIRPAVASRVPAQIQAAYDHFVVRIWNYARS